MARRPPTHLHRLANGDFTRAELDRSTQFDRYRVLKGAEGNAAVEALVAALEAWELRPLSHPQTGEVLADRRRVRARRPGDAVAIRAAVSAVAANLFALARHPTHSDAFVAIGFASTDYPAGGLKVDRYKRSAMGLRNMTTVRDFLCEVGFVDFHPGSHDRDPAHGDPHGLLSRMRARAALVEALEAHGVTLANVGNSGTGEVVILKGKAPGRKKPKPPLQYVDSAKTNQWRATLEAVNRLLAGTVIHCPVTPKSGVNPEGLPDGEDEEGSRQDHLKEAVRMLAGDQTARSLYRIFNNGRWEHGGRIYGGQWEGASKADRKGVTINGAATVELDFSGMHPHMLYSMRGLEPHADPYKLEVDGQTISRDLCKTTFQRAINGDTPGMPKAAKKGDPDGLPSGVSFEQFRDAYGAMHAPIADTFGTGIGLTLQRLDSDIAMVVLADLSVGRGIPVLPIHDSFIVEASQEDVLREAMERAYGMVVRMGDCPDIRRA